MQNIYENSFTKGTKDGLPIALGYLSVSFAFGITAVSSGLPIWSAIVISMTNLTSAGQFAGISMMTAMASYLEVALTQLVINLRYALMSLSLSQKLISSTSTWARLAISFGITDEIFAVSSTQPKKVGHLYMAGLILIPYFGWALGTALGAAAGMLLPAAIRSALGIAIYGMFLAIIVPPAKKSRAVLTVLLIAAALSCGFRYLPVLNRVSSGFVIILCAVSAAGIGALLFPIDSDSDTASA